MAIAATGGIVRLPFGERPQYGSPYPEGIAVGHIIQAGNGSGGDISFTFLADGGFLFRLEGFQIARGATAQLVANCITAHRWASDKSGLGVSSFDLNWPVTFSIMTTFGLFYIGSRAGQGRYADFNRMIRRLPMGRLDDVALQTLFTVTITLGNVNTITHETSIWFTYWRKESVYLPGFLSSFYEAPAAPPLIRAPA